MRFLHIETGSGPHATLTDGGVDYPYQVLTENITDQATVHERSMSVEVLVRWNDSNFFTRSALGYTQYTPGSEILNRHTPLECPWFPGLYCDETFLLDTMYDERLTEYYDSVHNWPIKEACKYRLRFSRLEYKIRKNEELPPTEGQELWRYVSIERQYSAKERRISGWGFNYYEPTTTSWKQVPDEHIFFPEHTIRYVLTWHQIPQAAVPWNTIARFIGYVNDNTWGVDVVFDPQTLMFRGPADNLRRYMGPDGEWYYDLAYSFEHRPGGWNNYMLPQVDASGDRIYAAWRRNIPGEEPSMSSPLPYPVANFNRLFDPRDLVFS